MKSLYFTDKIFWKLFLIGLFVLTVASVGFLISYLPVTGIGIALLFGLLVTVFGILKHPIWICYLIVFFTPLISGMPRGEIFPIFRSNEPLLIGLFVILIAYRINNSSKGIRIRITPVDYSFFVLLIGGTIIPMLMYLIRNQNIDLAGLFVYLSVIQYYLIYRIVIETVKTKKEIVNIINLILISGLIVTVVGILEAIHFPGVEKYLLTFYPSGHLLKTLNINRIVSILGNWHALAAYTIIQLIIVIAFLLRGEGIINLWLLIISGISSLVAMVPIVSLAGLAGLSTMIFSFLILVRRSWKVIFLSFLVLVVAASMFWPFVQERIEFQFGETEGLLPKTGQGRLNKWRDVFWEPIKDNFLFGFGPIIPDDFAWHTFESQYIAVLFKGGIIYFLAHLYFVLLILYWLYRKYRTDKTIIGLCALCALIMLVIVSVMGFANEYFTYSGVMEVFWVFLGLSALRIKE